eukprot:s1351_g8.t1
MLPLMSRQGGALFALPDKVLSEDQLLDAMIQDEVGFLGPSREFNAKLMMEEDIGTGVVDLENVAKFLVIDLPDAVFEAVREYDPVTDFREAIVPFEESLPNALPKVSQILPQILEWIDAVAHDRQNFYSAREEQEEVPLIATPKKATAKRAPKTTIATLASQLSVLQQQLQSVMTQQDMMVQSAQSALPSHGSAGPAAELPNGPATIRMPSLSSGLTGGTAPKKAASLLGPPPKTKAIVEPHAADVGTAVPPIQGPCGSSGDPVVTALSQQSLAITQLVAHLTGGDPMTDLASSSAAAGVTLNTKGVARREKMQGDLAQRTSQYFLQVQQQLYKRMYPSRAVPRTAEELGQADVSMTAYLERYGGFKSCREVGLTMWILAHAMDAAAVEDYHAAKEYMALLVAALEQSAMDGNWNVAYILSLMEEPPQQLFTERLQPMASAGRPFAPLVPPAWAAVSLSYLKEIEVLTTRKQEMKGSSPKQSNTAAEQPAPASPKRKPRFPRKPKASQEGQ